MKITRQLELEIRAYNNRLRYGFREIGGLQLYVNFWECVYFLFQNRLVRNVELVK